ncbi:MAG: hypothetical protein U5Q44_07315 [Dehalococcoidia bacterium]|nr:hypothetical protein [Dehalococcoidia bacterium]
MTVENSNIAIAKSSDATDDMVEPGDALAYTIDVTNAGVNGTVAAPQDAVTVTDVLPAGVTYVDASGDGTYTCSEAAGEVTCTNSGGDHTVGDTHSIAIDVTVDGDAAAGDIVNTASAEVTSQGANPDDATATVTVGDGEGEAHTYELTFRWTLIGWTLPDMDVADALNGEGANAGGDDISAHVTAVFGWDAPTQTWAAYFPDAGDVPGANDLETFESGEGYWIAIDEEAGVTWDVTTSGGAEE